MNEYGNKYLKYGNFQLNLTSNVLSTKHTKYSINLFTNRQKCLAIKFTTGIQYVLSGNRQTLSIF